jgi:hypothetical protein
MLIDIARWLNARRRARVRKDLRRKERVRASPSQNEDDDLKLLQTNPTVCRLNFSSFYYMFVNFNSNTMVTYDNI